jgi:hypothetical protein
MLPTSNGDDNVETRAMRQNVKNGWELDLRLGHARI